MKCLIPILLSLSVLCTSLTAVEYGYLRQNQSIILEDGDTFSMLGCDQEGVSPQDSLLTINIIGDNRTYDFNHNDLGMYNQGQVQSSRTFCGPCTLTVKCKIMFYKITRASEEVLTSNTVTLPAVNGLDWAVTLEQSTDLANWTAVAPGTVTGTDSLQFYRIRVTSNASSGE